MAGRKFSWVIGFLACVVTLALLCGYAVWRVTRIPEETATAFAQESSARLRDARAALVDLFHLRPEVRTQDGPPLSGRIETTERLGLVRRETDVSRETSATWWGSTKTVRLRGTYRVEAGFDLAKGLAVGVEGATVRVTVPHAELLSVETVRTHVEALRDGLWNRVQPADLDAELAALPEKAKQESADLPGAAEVALRKALQDRLDPLGLHLDLEFTELPLPRDSVKP